MEQRITVVNGKTFKSVKVRFDHGCTGCDLLIGNMCYKMPSTRCDWDDVVIYKLDADVPTDMAFNNSEVAP